MKRGKRPGTRGSRRADSLGSTDPFEQVTLPRPRVKARLPSDLADAAEAALDDMLVRTQEVDDDEPRTQTRAPSQDAPVAPGAPAVDEEASTHSVRGRRSSNKMPLPAPPRTTAANVVAPAQLEPATVDLGPPADETARVVGQLPLDLDSGPLATDPDELVPVPAITPLQVAVFEESAHLPSAQGAVVAAGHVVRVGGGGPDGLARVLNELRGGELDVVIAALPGGEPLIKAALALEPRRPIVIATVAGSSVDAVARGHAAGADLAVPRPHDVERLAPVLFAATRLHLEKRVALAARGAEQVLRARLDELADPEPHGLLPFELFQRVLELEIKRAKRFEYPLSVALFAVEIPPPPPPPGIRGILRARAGNALIHTVRDIDIATQLDHERFLVLLPYTDLKGAAGLGRRVVGAVAAGVPVVAAGRTFPPRVVGAVAGALPGQPVSFAKLMKDATRALDQARRDGAELAVQP